MRARYAFDPDLREKLSAKARARNTGMSIAQTEELRVLQCGLCAVCSGRMDIRDKRSALGECADHCHSTGRVRGLLCKTCNQSLGWFERWATKAQIYLDNPPADQVR